MTDPPADVGECWDCQRPTVWKPSYILFKTRRLKKTQVLPVSAAEGVSPAGLKTELVKSENKNI